MVKEILLLGNKQLYEVSEKVQKEEIHNLKSVIEDLHDTIIDYRSRYGAGRAIAAPQIGIKKRIIYMNIDHPVIFFNPVLEFHDDEMMKVLDDCMSFPGLYVYVMRYRRCRIKYYDMNWKECTIELEGDLSELLQHEYDHLDGVLATMQVIDNKSFVIKNMGK
jgi:peptide deformylase